LQNFNFNVHAEDGLLQHDFEVYFFVGDISLNSPVPNPLIVPRRTTQEMHVPVTSLNYGICMEI